jgi:predicted 3-demethylubiquinone-9 3-methyltransferase (glyoxalase superfamily)
MAEENYMQKITPFLWFNDNLEEAMNFYVSIFKNSRIVSVSRYGEAGPGPKGTAMGATFELDGQQFLALNGGPHFSFTPAISMFVNCETQDEIDDLWEKLSAGGEKSRCGWLKDKFGLSWQIVPSSLGEMLQDKNPEKSKNTMQAMLQMNKLDIAKLRQAHDQG